MLTVSILCTSLNGVVFAASTYSSTYSIITGEYVRLLGRGEIYKGGRSFNNPNSGFEFIFEGTKAEVYVPYTSAKTADVDPDRLNAVYFNVTVDGGEPTRIVLDAGWNTLVEGLDYSTHIIRCVRSSECIHGKIVMSQIRVDGPSSPKPTEVRERRMEFYGDSYTVGYGNVPLGIPNEKFCAKNTDHWKSYASYTARYFNADSNVIAMSGRGVCMNYKSGETIDTRNTMLEQFWLSEMRTGWERHEDWDFLQCLSIININILILLMCKSIINKKISFTFM